MKLFPKDTKVESRQPEVEVREAEDLYLLTTTAREIMVEELQGRFFGERPLNNRQGPQGDAQIGKREKGKYHGVSDYLCGVSWPVL